MQSYYVKRALESLWTDVEALSRNPLIEKLGLVDARIKSDYERGMALADAILYAAQRLKGESSGSVFRLLNLTYGLEGGQKERYRLTGAFPSHEEIASILNITTEAVEEELQQAISVLSVLINSIKPPT